MSFLDAMNEAEEPETIFHIDSVDDDDQVWRTGMSETTVQEVAQQNPDEIFFVATEQEVSE